MTCYEKQVHRVPQPQQQSCPCSRKCYGSRKYYSSPLTVHCLARVLISHYSYTSKQDNETVVLGDRSPTLSSFRVAAASLRGRHQLDTPAPAPGRKTELLTKPVRLTLEKMVSDQPPPFLSTLHLPSSPGIFIASCFETESLPHIDQA